MVLVLLVMLLVVVVLLFSWLLVYYLMQKSDSHYQITTQGADFVHVLLQNSHDEINRGQINLKKLYFFKICFFQVILKLLLVLTKKNPLLKGKILHQ
jgi:hypothetical protein